MKTSLRGTFVWVAIIAVSILGACKKEDEEVVAPIGAPANTCSNFSAPAPPTGANTVPLLIVRIQFAGELFDGEYRGDPFAFNHFQSNACVWATKIFGNQEGQLNHYFGEVSNDKFQLVPVAETEGVASDGIVTVTLPGNHPNPGSEGFFIQKLVDAVTLADPHVDFSSYDSDKSGRLSRTELQVMFLVAGYEASSGAPSPFIWAHAWCVGGQELGVSAPTLDNTEVLGCSGNGYSRFGERHMKAGHDATIGIIAHELGHAIWGLPDLYDTDGTSAGIGKFGVMSSGSWGRQYGGVYGSTPTHMTAWTKIKLEFYTAAIPANGAIATLSATGLPTYNIAKIEIPETDNKEYFLLENRGTTGYDRGLDDLKNTSPNPFFHGGMAIWHIDENQSTNANEAWKRVDLEEAADPGLDLNEDDGAATNLFWSTNNDTFDGSSSPKSDSNDGSSTNIAVTGISNYGSTMTVIISHP